MQQLEELTADSEDIPRHILPLWPRHRIPRRYHRHAAAWLRASAPRIASSARLIDFYFFFHDVMLISVSSTALYATSLISQPSAIPASLAVSEYQARQSFAFLAFRSDHMSLACYRFSDRDMTS